MALRLAIVWLWGGVLMLVNSEIGFVAQDLLAYTLLGVLVFTFFNFRTKAKCFAGDVGSVAIAYPAFCLGGLDYQNGQFDLFSFSNGVWYRCGMDDCPSLIPARKYL